jgi:ubiquitin-protein ligase
MMLQRSSRAYKGKIAWSASGITVLMNLASLLHDPNTGSPANVEASNLYKDNRREYTKRVKETVEKSWED